MHERNGRLKAKISAWQKAFKDERSGITKSVDDLIWRYATFRTAIRIVRYSNERGDGGIPLNQMIFDMMADGYWQSLLIGTRRLIDPASLSGPDGVYSIRSVLRDVSDIRHKITRKVFIEEVKGLPYDISDLAHHHAEELRRASRENPPRAIWGDPRLTMYQYAQHDFDFLSGKAPADRNKNDLIRPEVFESIERRLVVLDPIYRHVNKHLAHAANEQSRLGHELEDFGIREAREVLRTLKTTATLIGGWFANEGSAGLATFQGDLFEGLDKPVIDRNGIALLEQNWQEIDAEVASWKIEYEDL
jgi:hypothetical protein